MSNKSSVIRSPVIISHASWEPTNFRLGPKKPNIHGGYSVAIISNQTNAWPSIASPTMTTWGLNELIDREDPSKVKFSLSHQFPSPEYPSPECDAFLDKIKIFDEKVIDLMTDNSALFWGKSKIRDVVADTFVSSLKYPGKQGAKLYDKAPTWNPKIRVYPDQHGNEDWKLEIYNAQRNRVFPNKHNIPVATLLPKLCQCRTLARCNIYISGPSWGITWTLEQTMIVAEKINRSVIGVCQFDPVDDEYNDSDNNNNYNDYNDSDNTTNTNTNTTNNNNNNNHTNTYVDDDVDASESNSESDSDEQPVDEPTTVVEHTPVPTPTPVVVEPTTTPTPTPVPVVEPKPTVTVPKKRIIVAKPKINT